MSVAELVLVSPDALLSEDAAAVALLDDEVTLELLAVTVTLLKIPAPFQ